MSQLEDFMCADKVVKAPRPSGELVETFKGLNPSVTLNWLLFLANSVFNSKEILLENLNRVFREISPECKMGGRLSFPDTRWNSITEEGLFRVLGWLFIGERGVTKAWLTVWFPGYRPGHVSWPWTLVQSLIFSSIKAKNYLDSTPRADQSI